EAGVHRLARDDDGEGDAVHHRRRTVLLRHVVDNVGFADALRVLARPRNSGTPALAATEPRACPLFRRLRDRDPRVPRGVPGLLRHERRGRIRGGDLDRDDRPLHRVRDPDLPAGPGRRCVGAGRVEPGPVVPGGWHHGVPLGRVHLDPVHPPDLDELNEAARDGAVDTVVAAFTDMQGRLMGKRVEAGFFVDECADHGLEGCNYLLALDMEMNPGPGYAMASWERGYGDFHLHPDLATLRRLPWLEGTALVLCDVAWEDGSPVVASPRQVLRAQVERARAAGFEPMFGSALEIYLLNELCAADVTNDYG